MLLKRKVQAPFLKPKLGIFTPDVINQETTYGIHEFFCKTQNSSFFQISTYAAPTAKSIQRRSYKKNVLWFEYQHGLHSFLFSTKHRPLLKLKQTPIQGISEFVVGIKLPDHSLSSSGEVKSERSQTATPPTCLHGVCAGLTLSFLTEYTRV